MLDLILTAAFFGIPATFLVVFTAWMIHDEFSTTHTTKGTHTNEMD